MPAAPARLAAAAQLCQHHHMCIICIDYAKGVLTSKDARRHLGEMAVTLDKKHVEELKKKLDEDDAKAKKP